MTVHLYSLIFFFITCSYIFSKKFLDDPEVLKISIYMSCLLILISGFRWKVGGDWDAYYQIALDSSFNNLSFRWSFIYRLINVLSSKLFLGIYGVNLIVTALFFYALYKIAKTLNFDFFLLIIISFSLVYFTGIMGFVRQSVALSFLILFTCHLTKGNYKISLIYYFCALTTHSSVIIFAPILIYVLRGYKYLIFLILVAILIFIYLNISIITSNINQFLNIGDMVSAGIRLRLIPLMICSFIFIFFSKKILTKSKDLNYFIIYNFILIIILNSAFILLPFLSAVIDRFNFFFFIFQIIIIGRFFLVIEKNNSDSYLINASFVGIFYFTMFYIWLVFGHYSVFWQQYNFLNE